MEPYNMNNRMKMVNTKNLQGYLTSWLVSVIDTKSFETKKEFWYSIEGHDIQIKTVTKYVIIEEGNIYCAQMDDGFGRILAKLEYRVDIQNTSFMCYSDRLEDIIREELHRRTLIRSVTRWKG